jgi:hypothetical protein
MKHNSKTKKTKEMGIRKIHFEDTDKKLTFQMMDIISVTEMSAYGAHCGYTRTAEGLYLRFMRAKRRQKHRNKL